MAIVPFKPDFYQHSIKKLNIILCPIYTIWRFLIFICLATTTLEVINDVVREVPWLQYHFEKHNVKDWCIFRSKGQKLSSTQYNSYLHHFSLWWVTKKVYDRPRYLYFHEEIFCLQVCTSLKSQKYLQLAF